jgi:hypothetical protein
VSLFDRRSAAFDSKFSLLQRFDDDVLLVNTEAGAHDAVAAKAPYRQAVLSLPQIDGHRRDQAEWRMVLANSKRDLIGHRWLRPRERFAVHAEGSTPDKLGAHAVTERRSYADFGLASSATKARTRHANRKSRLYPQISADR